MGCSVALLVVSRLMSHSRMTHSVIDIDNLHRTISAVYIPVNVWRYLSIINAIDTSTEDAHMSVVFIFGV